ncbi:hypothetical protein QBC34DRAFT_38242 [Podospora aff. communis PSN243]|uniref:C2H2-type domain-containing protein n=1 Tax=Podospora aff. communis PSN243 TaxID=3040156 RepID=A0AAV9GVC6_9PEZI|nr:hypothetical protein QBC34DRAFT_38242 [Podospora aff. communis PSN243]
MVGGPQEYPSTIGETADAAAEEVVVGWEPGSIKPGLSVRTATERLSGLRDKNVGVHPSNSQRSRDSAFSWLSDSTRLSRTESIFSVVTPRLSRSPCRQSSIDSEPVSAISPGDPEQLKDDPANRYFCTFCDQSFGVEADWRAHEESSHGDSKSYCCRDCGACYALLTSLSAHLQQAHGADSLPAHTSIPEPSGAVRTWGCGFCPTALYTHPAYLDHIAKHFDDEKERVHWHHASVIKALLHQTGLRDSWERLVEEHEAAQGMRLRFSWDSRTGLILQSILERFSMGKDDPREFAGFAYHTAQVKIEANASGRYTTDGRVSLVRPTPVLNDHLPANIPIAAQQDPARSSSGITPRNSAPARAATEASISFSSRNAKKSTQTTEKVKVMVKIEETAADQSSPAPNPAPQRSLLGVARDSPKQGLLRRVGSDWNLGPSRSGPEPDKADKEELPRSRSALAMRPARPSVNITTNDHGTSASASLLPTPSELTPDSHTVCEEWLSVTKPKSTKSAQSRRSPSGSSIGKSSHTIDQRYIDHSPTDERSDDTLSEPDLWFNLHGKSESTRALAHALHQTLDGLMRHLWTSYNRDWDALIHNCVGEQTGGHNQGGDFTSRGLAQASTSYCTPNRGLVPNIRRQFPDERDDDDDVEGYRPPSSQSKHSTSAPKRYACPFRKHDPATYNIHDHDICALRSWESVSRMKEHLYRKHCKVHCQRCKQVFRKQSELAAHAMRPESCRLREGNGPADISAQQELQLKSKKYASRYQSEEEKWREVYRLLFPGEHIPSPSDTRPDPELAPDIRPPSAESQNAFTFQHFLVSEMPQIFRQTAESHCGRRIDDHDHLTMESVNFIMTEAINKAFQEWEARGNPVPRHVTPLSLVQDSSIQPSPNMPFATPDPIQPDMGQPDLGQPDMGQFGPQSLLVSDFQPHPPPQAYSGWGPGDQLNLFNLEPVPQMPPTGDPGFVGSFPLDETSFHLDPFQPGPNYNGPWM